LYNQPNKRVNVRRRKTELIVDAMDGIKEMAGRLYRSHKVSIQQAVDGKLI
jgi:hypothetical protein